jgi:hypothetical protein
MPRKRIPADLRSLARGHTELCIKVLAGMLSQEAVPAAALALRFAGALAGVCAWLGADADRYSFSVRDLHPLLLAGLPAHSENLHSNRLIHRSK